MNAGFFREIMALARERYPADRASQHVSAMVERVVPPEAFADADLPALLDGEASVDTREALHVTFGPVLGSWGGRLMALLRANEDVYAKAIERHFTRHLAHFSAAASSPLS